MTEKAATLASNDDAFREAFEAKRAEIEALGFCQWSYRTPRWWWRFTPRWWPW